MKTGIANLLIIVGIFLLSLSSFRIWQRINPWNLKFNFQQIPEESIQMKASNYPVTLQIPQIGVDVPVIPAKISARSWEYTDNGVSFLATSPVPGEIGNSILYGHNWNNILGRLPRLKPGGEITVTLRDGSQKKFTVKYTTVVTPDQTHILAMTSDRRITIYTCTGFLDTKRFVVTAMLKEG